MKTRSRIWVVLIAGLVTALTFSCQEEEEFSPSIIYHEVKEVTSFTAELYSSFEVEHTNFKETGFVISTTEINSIEDGTKFPVALKSDRYLQRNIHGLYPEQTYYVKSYAIDQNDKAFIDGGFTFTTEGIQDVIDNTTKTLDAKDLLTIPILGYMDSSIVIDLKFMIEDKELTMVEFDQNSFKLTMPEGLESGIKHLDLQYKERIYNDVKKIEIRRGKWIKKKDIPWDKYSFETLSFISENKIFVVNTVENGEMWSYDIDGDKWSKSKNFIGFNFSNGLGLSSGGYGYLIGGNSNKGGLFMFDPYIDAWIPLAEDEVFARRKAFGYIKDNKIFIGGGMKTIDDYILYNLSSYDTETEKISVFADRDIVLSYINDFKAHFNYLYAHSAIVLNDTPYVFGGRYYNGSADFNGSTLAMKIIEEDTSFHEVSKIPSEIQEPLLFKSEGHIYVGDHHFFYEFDVESNSWKRLSSHPEPESFNIFVHEYDNKAYVGTLDNEKLTIWEFDPNY